MLRLIALFAAAASVSLAVPAAAQPKNCPPGLAKKNPPCVPPGLAKKNVTEDQYRDRRYDDDDDDDYVRRDWRIGDRIDRDRYVRLEPGDRVVLNGEEYLVVSTRDGILLRRADDYWRLPRVRDGGEYVRIGDSLIRVNRETSEIIQVIRLADLLLN